MGYLAEQAMRQRFQNLQNARLRRLGLKDVSGTGFFLQTSARKTGAVVVTGDKAIDKRLHALIPKAQKWIVRKATRDAIKTVVLPEARHNVMGSSYDTGDFHDSLTVRARKRSRRVIGHQVVTRKVARSSTSYGWMDVWYYKFPELGSKHQPAEAPMRKAIYETINEQRDVFFAAVRGLILKA